MSARISCPAPLLTTVQRCLVFPNIKMWHQHNNNSPATAEHILLPFAGPTRAPEDVSHWFEGDTLLVKWTPIPILFQAYRLQGYAIVATKRDVKIADWNEPANATNTSKSGVKADEIDCVIVYGYNKYKGGYSSSCPTTEAPGTLQWFL